VATVPDRWDALTVVNLLMTESGQPPHDWDLVTTESLRLTNGRHIWLGKSIEQIHLSKPEPMPDGNIIEIRDPDEHEAACPGSLLRPFHLGWHANFSEVSFRHPSVVNCLQGQVSSESGDAVVASVPRVREVADPKCRCAGAGRPRWILETPRGALPDLHHFVGSARLGRR
jgi:hypothetical protein